MAARVTNLDQFARKIAEIEKRIERGFSTATIGQAMKEAAHFTVYVLKEGMERGTDIHGVRLQSLKISTAKGYFGKMRTRRGAIRAAFSKRYFAHVPLLRKRTLYGSIGVIKRSAMYAEIGPRSPREQLISAAHNDPQPRAAWGGKALPKREHIGFRDKEFKHRAEITRIFQRHALDVINGVA